MLDLTHKPIMPESRKEGEDKERVVRGWEGEMEKLNARCRHSYAANIINTKLD